MLTRVDRVQVVVPDRQRAAAAFRQLLGGEVACEDRITHLSARRTVFQIGTSARGTSAIELLEPDGSGPTAEFLAATKGGLFAAGFATPDVARLCAHLQERQVTIAEEGEQLFVSAHASGIHGMHVVISPETQTRSTGLLRCLYEVTLLTPGFASAVERTAATFALNPSHFVPIGSPQYGYEGVLTLFDPNQLDRIEVVTPNDPAKTMGRFFAKRGPCLYMCYAEADDLMPIRARLLEHAPDDWTAAREGGLDNLFIHPKALGGLMMGISRTTVAWTWSGHPERVQGATV